MRYDDDMSKTLTEREVFERRMGRVMTDQEIYDLTPKRDRGKILDYLKNNPHIYKVCDICAEPFCVNNWPDGKSRTPKFKGFVICGGCDPRPIDDRFLKEGYRIVWQNRLRVIRLAQVTRALARYGCLKSKEYLGTCKCAGCAAVKLMGESIGDV